MNMLIHQQCFSSIRLSVLAIAVLFVFPIFMHAQGSNDLKEIFIEAEDHFIYHEYEDAVQLYPILDDGTNYNILYKIGVCYLNIPNEKNKAIQYLENAVMNASYDAKDELFTEKRAPLDAYFSLGNAYRINNELDKAIATYKKFKSMLSDKARMENEAFIDQAIKACEIARDLQQSPVSFIPVSLGENINLVSINMNPAVSGDEKHIVFTARFGEDNVVFHSEIDGSGWGPAVDITAQLGSSKDVTSCALSYDGKTLYLYKTDDQDGNIYVSTMKDDGTWSKITRLGKTINTKYYESHASVSADGNTLYFTSNRRGSLGELDIYVARRNHKGEWGRAENIGREINTPFNENTPFVTGNDSLLYFSSEGHNSMGGYDIFCSKQQPDGRWSTPVNVGYPINTTDDDLFFNPVQRGKYAYYALEDGYKEINLYRLEILPPGTRRQFRINGTVSLRDTREIPDENFQVALLGQEKGEVITAGIPDEKTGWYELLTGSGKYRIIYQGKGYRTEERGLVIDEYARTSEFTINVQLSRASSIDLLDTLMIVIDPEKLEAAQPLDTNMVIRNLVVEDLDKEVEKGEILYWTVQLMALRVKPVDVSFFLPIENVEVILGQDGFYRYTFGRYSTREEADEVRQRLMRLGYPDAWIKKVYRQMANN